jgi:hypothetical protein
VELKMAGLCLVLIATTWLVYRLTAVLQERK